MITSFLQIQSLKTSRLSALLVVLCAIVTAKSTHVYAQDAKVTVISSTGKNTVRAPGKKAYAPVAQNAVLISGTRVKTGPKGTVRLRFADGSLTEVKPGSEIIVKASQKPREKPNGAVVFFGRIWSKVTKSKSGDTAFEVRTANAVAGVRGTEFDTGVAADGTVVVRVSEGRVAVSGDDRDSSEDVDAGNSILTDNQGALGRAEKNQKDFDWDKFFLNHAKHMHAKGLKVAKALDGRLNRRKAKLKRLLAQQKDLKAQVERLVASRKRGENVDAKLKAAMGKLERVTQRLEDMKARLEGAFGLFESWGRAAKKGNLKDSKAIFGMANDVSKIAADFADMIEEGTDLSEEGMHELMDDMSKGKKSGPGESAADELFR